MISLYLSIYLSIYLSLSLSLSLYFSSFSSRMEIYIHGLTILRLLLLKGVGTSCLETLVSGNVQALFFIFLFRFVTIGGKEVQSCGRVTCRGKRLGFVERKRFIQSPFSSL